MDVDDDGAAGVFSGKHVLAELEGMSAIRLGDCDFLHTSFEEALRKAGATVRDVVIHRFEPQGVTVVAVLAESHASVHTYPEIGSAFVDVFTCGTRADPEVAVHLIAEALGASATCVQVIIRGTGAAGHRITGGRRNPMTFDAGGAQWITEPLNDGLRRHWRLDEIIWSGRTAVIDMIIAKTSLGTALFSGNRLRSDESSQLAVHEALVMPAFLLADRAISVLVLGFGEGVVSQLAVRVGALRVDHVDIDRECVEVCARLLPYGYEVAELRAAERGEGPVRMHYADGWAFLADAVRAGIHYDLIVLDLPTERDEPYAQHNRLYSLEFLRQCAAALTPGGVTVTLAGQATLFHTRRLVPSWNRFVEVFPTVVHFGSDDDEWSKFLMGTNRELADPTEHMIAKLAASSYRPDTIDAETLRRCTTPPYLVRQNRDGAPCSRQQFDRCYSSGASAVEW